MLGYTIFGRYHFMHGFTFSAASWPVLCCSRNTRKLLPASKQWFDWRSSVPKTRKWRWLGSWVLEHCETECSCFYNSAYGMNSMYKPKPWAFLSGGTGPMRFHLRRGCFPSKESLRLRPVFIQSMILICWDDFFSYANRRRGSASSDAPLRLVEVTANWTHTSADCGETSDRNVLGWVTWWQTTEKNPLQVWDGVVTHCTMLNLLMYFILFGWLINSSFLLYVGSWGHRRIRRDSRWNQFKPASNQLKPASNQHQTCWNHF